MNDADNAATLAAIRAIVTRHLNRRGEPDDDTPLISGGLIDSMKLIDLILELEEALGVRIPASEVQPDDFDSIRRIGETLARFR